MKMLSNLFNFQFSHMLLCLVRVSMTAAKFQSPKNTDISWFKVPKSKVTESVTQCTVTLQQPICFQALSLPLNKQNLISITNNKSKFVQVAKSGDRVFHHLNHLKKSAYEKVSILKSQHQKSQHPKKSASEKVINF